MNRNQIRVIRLKPYDTSFVLNTRADPIENVSGYFEDASGYLLGMFSWPHCNGCPTQSKPMLRALLMQTVPCKIQRCLLSCGFSRLPMNAVRGSCHLISVAVLGYASWICAQQFTLADSHPLQRAHSFSKSDHCVPGLRAHAQTIVQEPICVAS